MKEKRITSWNDFSALLNNVTGQLKMYRRVSSESHALRPKVGRPKTFIKMGYSRDAEEQMFNAFCALARPHLAHSRSIFGDLIIAQHHSLPTRLLDWSISPLVAGFFATLRMGLEGDAALYEIPVTQTYQKVDQPFDISETIIIRPQVLTTRIAAQSGMFTLHHKPAEDFTSDDVVKYVISKGFCPELRQILHRCGIHQATLFPDLDGIAAAVAWDYQITKGFSGKPTK